MAHSNGKITAPVGIDADIAPVLGVGSYDLGYLCSNAHGKINSWARYKPVRYESLAPGENEKWWQGWDGNCGIMPKRISSKPLNFKVLFTKFPNLFTISELCTLI